MNVPYKNLSDPLRVLLTSPLAPVSHLVATRILAGEVFGEDQLIDLILLVYSNEIEEAESMKHEFIDCAFECMNSIQISASLPSVSDADVFCFMTTFPHSYRLLFHKDEASCIKQFDNLYLMIKIANNLIWIPPVEDDKDKPSKINKDTITPFKKLIRPIFLCDGLLAMDILSSLSTNLPRDLLFCATGIGTQSKSILSDCIRVDYDLINDIYVWGANNEVFYVDYKEPLLLFDDVAESNTCDWNQMSNTQLGKLHQKLKLDHTQFGPSWLKKEYIEKVIAHSKKNPFGPIFKSTEFTRALRRIWLARCNTDQELDFNMGVISDGSIGTVKGVPYILPLIFTGDTRKINDCHSEENHFKAEIKKINKVAEAQHNKLVPYCKKFLTRNVIDLKFVPKQSTTTILMEGTTSSYAFSENTSIKTPKSTLVSYQLGTECECPY